MKKPTRVAVLPVGYQNGFGVTRIREEGLLAFFRRWRAARRITVRINGQKPASLDQIHVGDPVAAELTRLSAGYKELAERLEELDPRGATVSRAGTEKMKYSAN